LAQGIIHLANAGANVIVDDVIYLAEPFFQDGIIAQAVDMVAAAGVSYFSPAGNEARQSYESGFFSSGISGGTIGFVNLHDFDPTRGGIDAFQQITIPAGGTLTLFIQWDEPFGASVSDVDIYLLDAASVNAVVFAAGFDDNIGGDSFEFISYTAGESPETVHLAIDLFSGGPRPPSLGNISTLLAQRLGFPTSLERRPPHPTPPAVPRSCCKPSRHLVPRRFKPR
jgi:hypothetical protein